MTSKVIGRLSVIWKSDLTNKIKRSSRVDTPIWIYNMVANKTYGENAWWKLHKNARNNIEQVLAVAPLKAVAIWPPTTHHENYLS